MNMDDYWSIILNTDLHDLGCHWQCLDCNHGNQLCSPCRWKSIVEATSAKDRVYAKIAAEAITEIGIGEELPPNPSKDYQALYSMTVAMKPFRNCKRDDIVTFLYALR